MTRSTAARLPQSAGSVGRLRRWLGCSLALLAALGCAGHSDRTRTIRSALDAGQPQVALSAVNATLDVESEKDLPKAASSDSALLLLDRAMILQQLGQYALSSRDFEVADKQVEILDLSRGTTDEIGKYLFSDDTGPYRAPAYEKLLVNTENMVNYLSRGDLNGARIEARRLAVMQKYLSENEDPARALIGPGSYLAGFTFEKSGRADEALRHYEEALSYGEYPSLSGPVRRLLARGSYSSASLRKAAANASESSNGADLDADILVIIGFGRVPAKEAKRLPIGLALTAAAGGISPEQSSQANRLAAQGLVTWVNYPELGPSTSRYATPTFTLDGRAMSLESGSDVAGEAKRVWDGAKGKVIASAITRLISRLVAGEVARHATKDQLVGTLLSLGVQATLTATDTPDTRSWQTLPAQIVFGRVPVRAGEYQVELVTRGVSKRQRVKVEAGGFAVVNQTVLF